MEDCYPSSQFAIEENRVLTIKQNYFIESSFMRVFIWILYQFLGDKDEQADFLSI